MRRWTERNAWPWLWVLAPLWLPTAVALAAAPFVVLVTVAARWRITLRQPATD